MIDKLTEEFKAKLTFKKVLNEDTMEEVHYEFEAEKRKVETNHQGGGDRQTDKHRNKEQTNKY